MCRLRVAVLISGRGTNLQALIDACAMPGFPAEIVLVVANRSDAAGLVRARDIPAHILLHTNREEFEAALNLTLDQAQVKLVCLAGFMRILSPNFVNRWRDRLINIHPSLLPSFPGLNPHQQALDAGVRVSGCTVHFVRAAIDDGPIIVQAAVPVVDGDNAEILAARVLAAEHQAYPLALRLVAQTIIGS